MAGYAKRTVLLIHERPVDSLISDAGTFIMAAALIGLGVVVDSAAMQWVGAIIFFISFGSISAQRAGKHRMTVEEARKRLDDIEGVTS